jgi:hypothetical protein
MVPVVGTDDVPVCAGDLVVYTDPAAPGDSSMGFVTSSGTLGQYKAQNRSAARAPVAREWIDETNLIHVVPCDVVPKGKPTFKLGASPAMTHDNELVVMGDGTGVLIQPADVQCQAMAVSVQDLESGRVLPGGRRVFIVHKKTANGRRVKLTVPDINALTFGNKQLRSLIAMLLTHLQQLLIKRSGNQATVQVRVPLTAPATLTLRTAQMATTQAQFGLLKMQVETEDNKFVRGRDKTKMQ